MEPNVVICWWIHFLVICFEDTIFDLIDLSQRQRLPRYYFIAFHQGFRDFRMHDPLRDSVYRAPPYMSLVYSKNV